MAKAAAKRIAYSSIKRPAVVEMILSNAERGITTVVQSHTGNSKSALINDLKKRLPNHGVSIANMALMQPGDLMFPKFATVEGVDVVRGAPHEQLGLHEDKPMIIFLDEIYKAPKALQVQIADLVYERRLGTRKLHPDSVVFGASNLESEGFSDASVAFARDRMAHVEMAKVTGEEWTMGYALEAGIHPTILESAREFPSMFADFRDYDVPGENQYILDPRKPQDAFVTLRSLERASNMLYGFEKAGLGADDITHALTKTVGPRAAADIMSVHVLHEELPSWAEIVKLGAKAKTPKSAGARCLLIYTAISSIDEKSVKPWMDYAAANLKTEEQALFAGSILKVQSKSSLVSTHKDFLGWVKQHNYLY